jgi:hypothetical protein
MRKFLSCLVVVYAQYDKSFFRALCYFRVILTRKNEKNKFVWLYHIQPNAKTGVLQFEFIFLEVNPWSQGNMILDSISWRNTTCLYNRYEIHYWFQEKSHEQNVRNFLYKSSTKVRRWGCFPTKIFDLTYSKAVSQAEFAPPPQIDGLYFLRASIWYQHYTRTHSVMKLHHV